MTKKKKRPVLPSSSDSDSSFDDPGADISLTQAGIDDLKNDISTLKTKMKCSTAKKRSSQKSSRVLEIKRLREVVDTLKKKLEHSDGDILYHESRENDMENEIAKLKSQLAMESQKRRLLQRENGELQNFIWRDNKRAKW